MKITFFGGPKDGEQVHVNPANPESDKYLVPIRVPAKVSDSDDPLISAPTYQTKHYWLHVPTAQYIWCDTHWPPDK